jgi:hypothetical protein
MFRIEKKPGTGHDTYTHNVYFKDKLMSNQGYYHNGAFSIDDTEEIDLEEFFPLKVAEVPPWVHIGTYEHFIYKEFTLVTIYFTGNQVTFDVGILERDFISSGWRFSLFKYAVISCAVKMFGNDSEIEDGETSAYFDFPVECQKGETIKDAYMRAQKTVSQIYEAATEKLNSQLN